MDQTLEKISLEQLIREISGGKLADFGIEATGKTSVVEAAIEILKPGGKLTVLVCFLK